MTDTGNRARKTSGTQGTYALENTKICENTAVNHVKCTESMDQISLIDIKSQINTCKL